MEDHIFKLVEIVGTSTVSTDEAVRNALKKASKSLQKMRWFQVVETRGSIKDGDVDHWEVILKVGFRLED